MSIPLLLSLVALFLIAVCLGLVLLLYKKSKEVQTQAQYQLDMLSELKLKTSELREEIHEIRSGSFGINKRVKDLMQEVVGLQSAQQHLAEQDPQSRFYNKAAKLIDDGASLSEVMLECDIPAAEAELLFNLHKNKN